MVLECLKSYMEMWPINSQEQEVTINHWSAGTIEKMAWGEMQPEEERRKKRRSIVVTGTSLLERCRLPTHGYRYMECRKEHTSCQTLGKPSFLLMSFGYSHYDPHRYMQMPEQRPLCHFHLQNINILPSMMLHHLQHKSSSVHVTYNWWGKLNQLRKLTKWIF